MSVKTQRQRSRCDEERVPLVPATSPMSAAAGARQKGEEPV